MAMKIVILEDNCERTAAMRECLADRFRQYEATFFSAPAKMIAYLVENLPETILISLDHDLELESDRFGQLTDPGTGREVADFLAGQPPVCPVIIHSSNSNAAVGMEMVLQDANWETHRVVPFDDLAWIQRDWFRAVRRAIVAMARTAK